MSAKYAWAVAAAVSLAAVTGCKTDKKHESPNGEKPAMKAGKSDKAGDAMMRTATATLSPSKNATTQPAVRNVAGEVTFTEVKGGIKVVANVTGLEPGKKHGFHIHQKGDLSAPDLSSAGDHFDPTATNKHGGPGHEGHVHAGDLGNLSANDKGIAHLEMEVKDLQLTGENGIVGRSVIVHAKADDYKSQPSGASGARIAGGKIELK